MKHCCKSKRSPTKVLRVHLEDKNCEKISLFSLISSTIHVPLIYHTFSCPLVRVDKSELCTQRVAQKRRGDHLSWLAHEIKPFEYLSVR